MIGLSALTSAEFIRLMATGIPGYDPFSTGIGFRFDEEEARKRIGFFPSVLRHVKGELGGQPFQLEPWQAAIIGNLFGWKEGAAKDAPRRYRECFDLVARKNGKTPLAGGIILCVGYCDGEPGAEIYSSAADFKQACLVFQWVAGMIRQEPILEELVQIYDGLGEKMVKWLKPNAAGKMKPTGSYYQVITTDQSAKRRSAGKHGFNTHLAVIDELHALQTGDSVEAIITSTGARRQPLIFEITTSDFEREGSVCNAKHNYAMNVRDGLVDDPRFLPVLYEVPMADDWHDPATWTKANPNLNVSVKMEFLQREYKRACADSAYENTFRRLHLNQRTEQAVRVVPMHLWDACPPLPSPEELKGKHCIGALDLSSKRDMTAFVQYFPELHAVVPHFWVTREALEERRRKDRVPYDVWAKDGHLNIMDSRVIDYDVVLSTIKAIGKTARMRTVAVDTWNSAYLEGKLDQLHYEVILYGQGFKSMTPAMKKFKELIIEGKLRHGGHPVLRWMAGNLAEQLDPADNTRPSRKNSGDKIDGVVALIMAIGAWQLKAPSRSVYEDRGLLRV